MFAQGFRKTAAVSDILRGVGKAVGSVGEKATHLGKRIVTKPFRLGGHLRKGIQEGAATSALARKGKDYGEIGKGLATSQARRSLEQKALRREGKLTPQMSAAIKEQVQMAPPSASPELKKKIMTRAKSMKAAANQKPSFASRHPYLTAGGAFLAGSYAMGGPKEPQAAQQPQIMYGNY